MWKQKIQQQNVIPVNFAYFVYLIYQIEAGSGAFFGNQVPKDPDAHFLFCFLETVHREIGFNNNNNNNNILIWTISVNGNLPI